MYSGKEKPPCSKITEQSKERESGKKTSACAEEIFLVIKEFQANETHLDKVEFILANLRLDI